MFLIKKIKLGFVFLSITLNCFSLDKDFQYSIDDIMKSEEYMKYQTVRNEYNICWNGASFDTLDSDDINEESPFFIKDYLKKLKDLSFLRVENKYKKFIVDLIWSKLFLKDEDDLYYPNSKYDQIIENKDYVLKIREPIEKTKQASNGLMMMYFLYGIDCFFLSRGDVFFDLFIKNENIKPESEEFKVLKRVSDVMLQEESAGYWEHFVNSIASEKISSFDMMQVLRGSIKEIMECIQQEKESFCEFISKYRFRYELLKTCFPDLFFKILKQRDGGFFSFLRTGNLKNQFSLLMNPLKTEAAPAPFLLLCLKNDQKNFMTETNHEVFLPVYWEKLNKDFFDDFFLMSRYFEPIINDILVYPPVFLEPSKVSFTDKRQEIKEKVMKAQVASEAQRCRLLLKRYYLFSQSSLIDIASDGTQSFSSNLKIREKKTYENQVEFKLKENIKNLYQNDFFLLQILKGDLEEENAQKIYQNLKKCDSKALERLEKKYAYRDFLMNDYYSENIRKKESRILAQIESRVEAQKLLMLEKTREQEKLAAERDQLFQELIDEEEKNKKSGKKKKANNISSKAKSKSKKKKSSVVSVKKEIKKEVSSPQPKKVVSLQKKGNEANSKKKPGNQNQKKVNDKSIKISPQPSVNVEKKIDLKQDVEKKEENESNIIILNSFDQNLEEHLLIQKNIKGLQNKIITWEKENAFLQEEIDKKEAYYNEVFQENENIKKDIKRLINYLKEVQKSKNIQKERFNKELSNLETAIKNSNVEQWAAQDAYFLKQQVQLILESSYAEFYLGIQSMNEMIARKFQLSQEIYFLSQENIRLSSKIALKEKMLKKREEKKSNNNTQGIFSKIKEKAKIAKETVSFVKNQDFRKINLKELNLHFSSLLAKEYGVKSLNQKLQQQLEYTDRKLPAVLEKKEELQSKLFLIQKKYNSAVQSLNSSLLNDAAKRTEFYKEEMIRRIPSSKIRLDFSFSIADFLDSNEYAVNLVGQLRFDMQAIMSELRVLNGQVMALTERNAYLQKKLHDDEA